MRELLELGVNKQKMALAGTRFVVSLTGSPLE